MGCRPEAPKNCPARKSPVPVCAPLPTETRIIYGFAQFRFACFSFMGPDSSRGMTSGAAVPHEILVRLPGPLAIRASESPLNQGFLINRLICRE